MRLGVIACTVLKPELDRVLNSVPEVAEVIYLDAALHIYPQKMLERLREEIRTLGVKVDAVFLGYGYCQSLRGLDEEFDFPVILPQVDDCISLLLTPERYAEEIRREVGTWFMSPGWAEVGAQMVIKELKLERAARYGRDPMEMARRLFTHYRRGLFIDTGVEPREAFLAKARAFCEDFNLIMDITTADTSLLAAWLEKARLATSQRVVLRSSIDATEAAQVPLSPEKETPYA
ncbi:conserved hypothetical protein [Syntrophobacter sp. SbD1]|nr:conserved hypothetical protein [Syntrophobacter sp. SbD1]